MGGGVAGWGSVCGAVSCARVYSLLMGTEGDESTKDFVKIREKMLEHIQVFIDTFEKKWGHVNFLTLLA